jgi:hypothetical protein
MILPLFSLTTSISRNEARGNLAVERADALGERDVAPASGTDRICRRLRSHPQERS